MDAHGEQKLIVVGAGPVGALAALYAAMRGYQVEVYELRGDLRDPSTVPLNFTKSINLALSERGINSLGLAKCAGLLESILEETIPMYGRMIHGESNGKLFEQAQVYDVHGRAILAVDRAGLNKSLLNQLETMPNVKLFFNHKLTGADFKRKLAWFEKRRTPRTDHAQNPTQEEPDERAPEVEIAFDFMIGADGAHSAVRFHMMKFARVSYQQEYIDTLWCEFHIPPASSGDFRLSPNHLHIWPGKDFMFIAIPSTDKSFTSTLFLPAAAFSQLDANPESLVHFFKTNFPGVVPDLITESEVCRQYLENPHLPLISIKCKPYHFNSSVVIVGDAAHAMVPFYGQGMNTGFEDIRVLFEIMDKHTTKCTTSEAVRGARQRALDEFTSYRIPDTTLINDLALRNYQEMRSDVQSRVYKLRKWVEEALSLYVPQLGWTTQYARISFGNERYSEVERATQRQLQALTNFVGLGVLSGLCWASWGIWRWTRSSSSGRIAANLFGRNM